MNLPNKLTIFRVMLIPVFLVFLFLQDAIPFGKWIALVVFIVASLTDLADGKIADVKDAPVMAEAIRTILKKEE